MTNQISYTALGVVYSLSISDDSFRGKKYILIYEPSVITNVQNISGNKAPNRMYPTSTPPITSNISPNKIGPGNAKPSPSLRVIISL